MRLEIDHLNHIYASGTTYERQALKDISFTINDHEFIGLIGHTGSGKSTLIQHLNGLLLPTSGDIKANGISILSKGFSLKNLRQKVGLVFQYSENQLFEATTLDDIAFGPLQQGLSKIKAYEKARAAMVKVGLDESYEQRSPFELSGGQKKRVAIAGVLAMEPEILILDEPTAGLDPKGREDILKQIYQIYEKDHISVLLVSHRMEDIALYSNRLIAMSGGEIIFDDEPKKVFAHRKELEDIHLGIPRITYMMQELKKKGLVQRDDIVSIEEATQVVMAEMEGKS